MLICLIMGRVYITKWFEPLADPTIIIGGTGRFIIRFRTFFGILEFYAWAFIFIIVSNSAQAYGDHHIFRQFFAL